MVNIKKCKILYIMASIILTVTLLLSSVDYQAAEEIIEYPSDKISCSIAISNNGGAYVDSNIPSHSSHSVRLTIIFDKPLSGKSTLNLSFFLGYKPDFGDSFKVDGIHFYDVKGNRVLSPSSSIVKINKSSNQLCNPTISDFSFSLDRDVQVNRIQLYFKTTDCSLSLSSYNIQDFVASYSVADFMEDVVTPSPEDKENMDNIKDNMGSQSSEIEDLIGDMDSMDKPDVGEINTDLSHIVSNEAIAMFSKALSVITDSKLVLSMMTIMFTIGVVGYALFGKRG